MVTEMCVAAANYIIEKTNEYNVGKKYSEQIAMSGKRLQKLLYFSDVQYMKQNNGTSMFTDEFYAWPSGPVIPSVYYQFMQYQDGVMMPINEEHTPITLEMQSAIDHILHLTNDMDTLDLVEHSHINGGPWNRSYDINDSEHKQIVRKTEIYAFYKNRELFASV